MGPYSWTMRLAANDQRPKFSTDDGIWKPHRERIIDMSRIVWTTTLQGDWNCFPAVHGFPFTRPVGNGPETMGDSSLGR